MCICMSSLSIERETVKERKTDSFFSVRILFGTLLVSIVLQIFGDGVFTRHS